MSVDAAMNVVLVGPVVFVVLIVGAALRIKDATVRRATAIANIIAHAVQSANVAPSSCPMEHASVIKGVDAGPAVSVSVNVAPRTKKSSVQNKVTKKTKLKQSFANADHNVVVAQNADAALSANAGK